MSGAFFFPKMLLFLFVFHVKNILPYPLDVMLLNLRVTAGAGMFRNDKRKPQTLPQLKKTRSYKRLFLGTNLQREESYGK